MEQPKHQTLDIHIAELKTHIVQSSSFVLGIASWLLLIWTLWPTGTVDVIRLTLRPFAFLLLLVSLFVYLVEKPLRLREAVLVIGTLLGAIILILVTKHIESLFFFLIPLALSYFLCSPALALTLTGACLIFTTTVVVSLGIFDFATVLLPNIIIGMVLAILYMSIRGLFTLVDVSNRSIELALHNQNQARERRAELVKTLKSLDIAQQNLHRTNYALQHARRHAEDARRLKQQFAQAISHELRTPLNLIIGFTESMIKSPEYYGQSLPPKYSHDLSIVYRNATHLQNMVNDVLDLARIEASHMTLQLEQVDLTSFLADVYETAVGLTRRPELAFKLEKDECLPSILWMDSIRIKQVLYNLLSNAERFTPTGHIILRVIRDNNNVAFSVIDTGIGIPAEHLDSIFEPFRQLENPMRRRIGGAGLGLSISRQLVELHGSRLRVESTPGKGSHFYFSLPVEPTVEPRTEGFVEPDKHFAKSEDMVLILTTRPSTGVLLSRCAQPYRALIVNSLDQLRMALQWTIPQAIIFDRSSLDPAAELDLTAFAAECKQATILLSLTLETEAALYKQLAVTSYLTKPILRDQLLDTLRLLENDIEHILIVDDDRDFIKLIFRMFDTPLKHYRISTALNGYEALVLLEKHKPDLLLLDLEMPGMNGVQLLKQIRDDDRFRTLPVVIMSAKEELEPYSAISANIEVFRAPYFTQQEILRMVRQLIE